MERVIVMGIVRVIMKGLMVGLRMQVVWMRKAQMMIDMTVK